jgi:hypothetical protein
MKIDFELQLLLKKILDEKLSEEQWKQIESSDMFQSENYIGGFDATEMAFTFSFYSPNGREFWFQLTLDEILMIDRGEIKEIDLRETD